MRVFFLSTAPPRSQPSTPCPTKDWSTGFMYQRLNIVGAMAMRKLFFHAQIQEPGFLQYMNGDGGHGCVYAHGATRS